MLACFVCSSETGRYIEKSEGLTDVRDVFDEQDGTEEHGPLRLLRSFGDMFRLEIKPESFSNLAIDYVGFCMNCAESIAQWRSVLKEILDLQRLMEEHFNQMEKLRQEMDKTFGECNSCTVEEKFRMQNLIVSKNFGKAEKFSRTSRRIADSQSKHKKEDKLPLIPECILSDSSSEDERTKRRGRLRKLALVRYNDEFPNIRDAPGDPEDSDNDDGEFEQQPEIEETSSDSLEVVKEAPIRKKTLQKKRNIKGKSYGCTKCIKRFTYEGDLVKHMESHTLKLEFKCRRGCDLIFKRGSARIVHERKEHPRMTYQCSYCDKSFSQGGSLKYHELSHTGETPFPCTFCEKKFKTGAHLQRHLKIHNNEKPETEVCAICNKELSVSSIKIHMRSHSGEKPYECDTCDKKFTNSRSLKKHKRVHTGEKPYQCRYCEKTFSVWEGRISHERTHTKEKPYECSICGTKFAQTFILAYHMRTHTGETPYPCTVCEKKFKCSAHLKRHMRIHNNEKIPRELCTICGQQISINCIKLHMRIHSGVKDYGCDACDKKFVDVRSLTKHKRVHTGEKPYQCRHCDMTFALREARISHERTHTGEKPYECSVCGKTHITSSGLTLHMRTHTGETPYPCTICDKQFKQGSHLKRHMVIHTNIKPYLCTECGKQFSDPSALKSHMRRHTGERPFECDICRKTFAHGSALKKHKRTHFKVKKSSNQAPQETHVANDSQVHLALPMGPYNETLE